MSNNLLYFSPELWSARIQLLRKNNLVGAAIASTEERAGLSNGYRVHRPYHSEVYAEDYVKGADVTFLDVTTTDEYLTVDQVKDIAIYVDDVDKIQNKYQTMDKLASRSAYELRNQMDQKILKEVDNFALGNSTAISLGVGNMNSVFSEVKAALFNNQVEEDKPWYAVIDGDTVSLLEQYMTTTGFKKLDETMEKGYGLAAYLGEWQGLQMFKSQNLPSTAVLGIATQPTDGDTVTVAGVTFTFKTSLGAAAGNVLIGSSADEANANLTNAINAGTGSGSTYVAVSAANRANLKRKGVVAVSDTSANTVTVTAAGKMVLAETLTAAADVWGTQTMKLLVGQMGNIDLVMQQDINAKFIQSPTKVGTNIITWDLYGTKTFVEGAQRGYALKINK